MEGGIGIAKSEDLASDVKYVWTSESVMISYYHLPRDWRADSIGSYIIRTKQSIQR